MKNLLWISLRAPYDTVAHAGGKIHNYYIKEFKKSDQFNIRLISFCFSHEVDSLDLDKYGIENDIYILNSGKCAKFVREVLNKVNMPQSLGEYFLIRREVKKKVKKLKNEGYFPDIVILQWTEIVMLLPFILRKFPQSRLISIEEDVTFLKMERKYKREKGIKRIILKLQHDILKAKELAALKASDLIVLNNLKDKELIIRNGVNSANAYAMVPYFNNMLDLEHKAIGHDILFYGAMNRPENIEAAEILIRDIFPHIKEKVIDSRLIILGGKPTDKILSYSCDSIIVTGFVEDVRPYFKESACLVAPLQMGAGVKIKILEALSSGLPVVTNDIGIEGIAARDNIEYIHCNTIEQFIQATLHLLQNKEVAGKIGDAGKQFIKLNYNIKNAIGEFIDIVYNL